MATRINSWESWLSLQCCFNWRVAMRALQFTLLRCETFLLAFPGSHDALANGSGRFLSAFARDVAVFHGRHFDVQIDAIEQRAGDALTVPLHLHGPHGIRA
jgi:hypothetical protein